MLTHVQNLVTTPASYCNQPRCRPHPPVTEMVADKPATHSADDPADQQTNKKRFKVRKEAVSIKGAIDVYQKPY